MVTSRNVTKAAQSVKNLWQVFNVYFLFFYLFIISSKVRAQVVKVVISQSKWWQFDSRYQYLRE